ncbi:Ran-binding protein 3 [Dermatophagoides pteronyssinus]|uniref:Ran-binding protein 3 n=1 Tax=Dermatophagoides pteronyssinus TaxID=6956 RepID=A0ABQ8IRB5_DERPT|nr:Ran-binding protein 3 [Dermatophagoides pteronyssinus]
MSHQDCNDPAMVSDDTATTNCADGDASDSSSTESQIIFAPPKLIPSSLGPNSTSSSSSGSFLQPSVLKTFDNSSSDIRKPNETISASKTFISLNKADIGKIKTPSFIKLSSPLSMTLSSANGSNMISSSLATSTNDETNKSVIKSPASTMMVDGGGSRAFLFGQKVEDRVVIDQSSDSVTNSQATAATSSSSLSFQTNASTTAAAAVSSSSSSSCLLSFSDVSNCEESTINTFTQQNPDDHPDSSTSFMSIMKNGADNNADSIFKRKYEVITGEEDEQNVLSIHGRLYAWDTDKATWVEKGRGPLHLNDVMKDEKLCSRLVMRTAGAYRLILNALIVAGMTFELASENCLRFTYIDGIYMIKANPKDIDQLHSAIEHRLREISKRMRSQDD